jgi:conjugal transfer pilin signal peptidase TrbI
MLRFLKIIAISSLVVLLLELFIYKFLFIGVNTSPSIEEKYLLGIKSFFSIGRGDLVAFIPEGRIFKLINIEKPKGEFYFVKRVVCLPGDMLTVNPQTRKFFCNGKFIGKALTVSCKGYKAPLFVWNGTIPKNRYFVMGETKCSYDSRYWGFVKRNQIKAKIYLTFGHLTAN